MCFPEGKLNGVCWAVGWRYVDVLDVLLWHAFVVSTEITN